MSGNNDMMTSDDILQNLYETFNPKPEEGTEAYDNWMDDFILWGMSDKVSQTKESLQKRLAENEPGTPLGSGVYWSDVPAFTLSPEEQEVLDKITASIFSIEKDMQKYYGLVLEYLERFCVKDTDTIYRISQLNAQTFEGIRNIKKAVDRSCNKLYR